jgi:hypothetical protein
MLFELLYLRNHLHAFVTAWPVGWGIERDGGGTSFYLGRVEVVTNHWPKAEETSTA